jgi:sarcosine oxidase subunit alpha
MEYIIEHPVLKIPSRKRVNFVFEGKTIIGFEGMMISSALFMNNIKIFGHHVKDNSPQGIFCSNGQCAQCTVIANGKPVKACMTQLKEGMIIKRCNGLPELPADNKQVMVGDPELIETQVLVIGAGPAGLSAAKLLGENGIKVIIVDDKDRLGGKLVLQTHKFFGSQEDVYAGKRGIEIAEILGNAIKLFENIVIWLNSTALAVFSDGIIGIIKNNEEYILVKPEFLLIATGAREQMLIFPGNTLPGVYGAGAFQTLVNRDLIKAAKRIFIVGGGNVGLITGYHAIQAGIEVVGLIEVLPQCGGYKVHEDKLRRLGVPICTNHTILSANGNNNVESITIAELDKESNVIFGTERTFQCDTILIAVGLNPVNELYYKAIEFGMKVWVAGDAQEIAEASVAIFSGKIEAIKILKEMEIETVYNLERFEELANIMKKRAPLPVQRAITERENGIFPLFHCNQEIPCNPCVSVCPQKQIATLDDSITQLPYFKGDLECTGCGRCVAVCPGLAITLVDYRKDEKNPIVTFPYELSTQKLNKDQMVTVVSNKGVLGKFKVIKSRIIKEFPRTQLISIKLPSNIAKFAVGIRLHPQIINKPLEIKYKLQLEDDTIVCRCERVTIGEIRKYIRDGVTDFNELKALTKVGMGACGGKTCTPLIYRIFNEEGITLDEITTGTLRPLFIEVPMGIFARIKNGKEDEI